MLYYSAFFEDIKAPVDKSLDNYFKFSWNKDRKISQAVVLNDISPFEKKLNSKFSSLENVFNVYHDRPHIKRYIIKVLLEALLLIRSQYLRSIYVLCNEFRGYITSDPSPDISLSISDFEISDNKDGKSVHIKFILDDAINMDGYVSLPIPYNDEIEYKAILSLFDTLKFISDEMKKDNYTFFVRKIVNLVSYYIDKELSQ